MNSDYERGITEMWLMSIIATHNAYQALCDCPLGIGAMIDLNGAEITLNQCVDKIAKIIGAEVRVRYIPMFGEPDEIIEVHSFKYKGVTFTECQKGGKL